jgi:hypothetical protein
MPTRYGWLRQRPRTGELKHWASGGNVEVRPSVTKLQRSLCGLVNLDAMTMRLVVAKDRQTDRKD